MADCPFMMVGRANEEKLVKENSSVHKMLLALTNQIRTRMRERNLEHWDGDFHFISFEEEEDLNARRFRVRSNCNEDEIWIEFVRTNKAMGRQVELVDVMMSERESDLNKN